MHSELKLKMSDYKKNIDNWKASVRDTSWVGVDLDATLAKYDGWHGPLHIGEPIEPMVMRVKTMIANGQKVKIFTARMSEPDVDVRKALVEAIGDWTEKHIGTRLEVTNVKTYDMIECYDDRIKQVVPNTGITLEAELGSLLDAFHALVKRVTKILGHD